MEKILVATTIFVGLLWFVDDKFADGRHFAAITQIVLSVTGHWAAS